MEVVYGDAMTVQIDKQGRIVIPKSIRERFGLSEGGRLELMVRENTIELMPLTGEDDPAIIILEEPCKTGDASKHDEPFSRERVWR